MIAARWLASQGARCPSCSASLLNSIFATQLRLPAVATTRAAGRYQAPVLQRRAFHRSTVRFNTTERPGEIAAESVTTSSEVVEEEEFPVSSTEGATESDVEIIEREFSQSSEEVATEPTTVGITREAFSEEAILEPALEAVEKKADPVPWFLRVETPRLTSHPLAERQALPETPSDAPPALEPLLKHLSQELGINDLSLLDLRAMDPPPAIGPNTIMIIGNARSERHLHISADKICRWLRSEWKMAPHADGLLGRNEIKIKNRRLKKRGKLVNTETGAVEGVGWICVDVRSQGLVVQLFTKERREEINLEKLWGKFLNKGSSIAKPVSIQEIFREKKPVEDVEVKYTPPAPAVRLGVGLSAGSGFPRTQTRSFHTTPHQHALKKTKPKTPKAYSVGDAKFRGVDVARCIERGRYWQLPKFPESCVRTERITISNLILRAQINHLKIAYPGSNGSGSRIGPCSFLGSGPADTTSTEFLSILHRNLTSSKPTPGGFAYHLEFLTEAHRLQPSAYPASCFLAHLNTMLAAKIPLVPEFYYLTLRAISDSPQLRSSPLPWEKSSTILIDTMEEVTEHMKSHCTQPNITIPEIQLCFFRALAPHLLDQVHTIAATICSRELALPNKPIDHVWRKFPPLRVGTYTLDPRLNDIDTIITKANHSYTLREYQEALLTAYAMSGAWIAFWNRWKSMRYMCVHRDAELYGLVIGLLVMAENQNECLNAVRWLPGDMAREVPGVGLTAGMARGMLRLVEIAEGERRTMGGIGEFGELRVRCEGVVERVRVREEKLKLLEVESGTYPEGVHV